MVSSKLPLYLLLVSILIFFFGGLFQISVLFDKATFFSSKFQVLPGLSKSSGQKGSVIERRQLQPFS